MGKGRFGKERRLPPGDWVQFSGLVSVAGIQFRREEVDLFCGLVSRAEPGRLQYGIELVAEQDNPHGSNAIQVIGSVERKPLSGSVRTEKIVIGYLPKEDAAAVSAELISAGLPFSGQLYSIDRSRAGFADIKILILGPKGHSLSSRRKRSKALVEKS